MTELAHTSRVPSPTSIGQATAVEQARAEAEVKAAVVVAQQCPRDVPGARAQMIESCEQVELAQRAFFRYNRGGSQITGPSIHLARELARCWGNVQYGIAEMRRDDVAGESEMMAFAWDVQTNTRSSSTFIVPHVRDRQGGGVRLTETRDIYENNANMGARRVREAIFAILPPWFTEQAKAVCVATIEKGDGTPLGERIPKMIAAYENAGIARKRLEDKVGLRSENWTAKDVAALTVVWKSLVARETTIEDEFPVEKPPSDPSAPAATRMAAMLGADTPSTETSSPTPGAPTSEPPADAQPSVEASVGEEPDDGSPTLDMRSKLAKRMFAVLGEAGIQDRDERLAEVTAIVGRTIDTSTKMTEDEARTVIATLEVRLGKTPDDAGGEPELPIEEEPS